MSFGIQYHMYVGGEEASSFLDSMASSPFLVEYLYGAASLISPAPNTSPAGVQCHLLPLKLSDARAVLLDAPLPPALPFMEAGDTRLTRAVELHVLSCIISITVILLIISGVISGTVQRFRLLRNACQVTASRHMLLAACTARTSTDGVRAQRPPHTRRQRVLDAIERRRVAARAERDQQRFHARLQRDCHRALRPHHRAVRSAWRAMMPRGTRRWLLLIAFVMLSRPPEQPAMTVADGTWNHATFTQQVDAQIHQMHLQADALDWLLHAGPSGLTTAMGLQTGLTLGQRTTISTTAATVASAATTTATSAATTAASAATTAASAATELNKDCPICQCPVGHKGGTVAELHCCHPYCQQCFVDWTTGCVTGCAVCFRCSIPHPLLFEHHRPTIVERRKRLRLETPAAIFIYPAVRQEHSYDTIEGMLALANL